MSLEAPVAEPQVPVLQLRAGGHAARVDARAEAAVVMLDVGVQDMAVALTAGGQALAGTAGVHDDLLAEDLDRVDLDRHAAELVTTAAGAAAPGGRWGG